MAQMQKNEVVDVIKNLIECLEVMDSKLFEPRYENQIEALTEAIRLYEFKESLIDVLEKAQYENKAGYGDVIYITRDLVEELLKKAKGET